MFRTAFDRLLGTEQGRLQDPSGWNAPEGSYLFVLGSNAPGNVARLSPGDNIEVFQTGDFGGGKIVRCQARIRPPASDPGGDLEWVAQLRIDDAVVTERTIPADRTRTLTDLAWCVARMNGDAHKLGFRLLLRGTSDPASEIELPAFYVDAIVLDPAYTPRPQAINRSPEPGETDVPIDTLIELDVVDMGPDGVSAANTDVYVNGVLALDGGVFQTGFSGTTSTPQADTLRISINRAADFASEELVTVRVVSATTGGTSASDTTYTFTAEDVIAPAVVSAQSVAEKKIRVVFNEPMLEATVLEASAYEFARAEGSIAVPVNALAVEKISEVEVEITLDTEITGGVVYTVTVEGVEDASGNAIADENTADFVGYSCPRPADREWDLYEMIPEMNRSEDTSGDLRKLLTIFQEVCDLLLCRVDRFTEIIDPDIAAIAFVEAMLDDLGNPFRFTLSDIDKRRLVQVLVAIYKQKGTTAGIIDAIRFFLGIEVTISVPGFAPLGLGEWELGVDWILGSGDQADLYTFWIHVSQVLTEDERDRMTEIANYMKAAHEHFRIVEPEAPPVAPDHLELGLSELGANWTLH